MASENRQLNLILELKDRASKELGAVQGKLQELQPQFRKMAAIGTAAFAGVAAIVGKTTQAAAVAEGTWNKFNTVFADGADEMRDFVEDLRTRMPTATDEIARMAADMQDLLIPMGLARDEAQDLTGGFLDLSNKVAAFNDVDPTKVLEAMKSGLVGSSEPLRQFGIDARVEALEQLAIDMGLVTDGFKELDPATRASVTAQVLFEQATRQSSDAIEGFEDNQDSFIRRQQELQATTKDISVQLGNTFIPIMDDLLKKLLPVIDKVSEWVKENPKLARNIILVTGAVAGLVAIVGFLGILFANVSLIVVAAVGAIVAVGALLISEWDNIKSAGQRLKEGFFDLLDGVKETYTQIKEATIEFVQSTKEKLMEWWDTWRNVIIFIVGAITGLYLPKLTVMAVQTAIQLAKMVAAWTVSTAKMVAQVTIQTATAIPSLIASYAKGAAAAVVTASKVVAQWVIMGVQSLIQAGRMALAWVIAMGPIAWVSALIIGLTALIIANWDTVKRVTIDVFTAIGKFFKDVWGGIKIVFTESLILIKQVWEDIKQAFKSAVDWIKSKTIDPLVESIEKIISAARRARDAVSNIGGRIQRGAQRTGSDIKSGFNNLFNVNDAVITPQGNVIRTSPQDYLFATKRPQDMSGGGMTINIDTMVGNEDFAEEMGNKIMRRLQMSNKFT